MCLEQFISWTNGYYQSAHLQEKDIAVKQVVSELLQLIIFFYMTDFGNIPIQTLIFFFTSLNAYRCQIWQTVYLIEDAFQGGRGVNLRNVKLLVINLRKIKQITKLKIQTQMSPFSNYDSCLLSAINVDSWPGIPEKTWYHCFNIIIDRMEKKRKNMIANKDKNWISWRVSQMTERSVYDSIASTMNKELYLQ